MAGRSHVDVNERRLRPIYDCLDNCNNKKALQEADKVLKKQKDFQCAKVLKALALLRLGRQEECCVLLDEVHAQSPVDESTLQAMCICYREMNQLDMIADMYENGHKANPASEEILSALFMAYVRLGDYKKQQQVAMKLHRLRPAKNPYYFWAVMSIVMQAHFADEKLAKVMFLPLAERMTLKYVEEEKIEAEAEVQMYLIILNLLGKYEEALQAVQGPLGERLTSEVHCREICSAELFVKLQRWPEANNGYRNLLLINPDHWEYYKQYFNSLFELMDSNWEPGEEERSEEEAVDHTVDRALVFLQQQLEKVIEEKRPVRGPYLAKMEFLRLLVERKSEETSKVGSAEELLREYYRRFGDKSCCFKDMKGFLCLLDAEQLEKMVQELFEESVLTGTEASDLPTDLKQMHRHITLTQLSHYLGLHDKLSVQDKLSLIGDLVRRHKAGLPFGESLLSTEFQFSDPYIQLAAYMACDLWKSTGDYAYIWQAIVLLETGLKASPSRFHFKILLIKLYGTMGAFGPSPALYDSMEVKHVQHDAVGYTISNHILRLGHFTSAYSLYETMLRFFTTNHKETTEYLISSYKYGSFTKIHEFVKFRERLQNSLQYVGGTAERILLDMILDMSSHQKTEQMVRFMDIDPEQDKTVYEELQDNRDMQVMPAWDPPERELTDKIIEQSFTEEKAWLKLRNLMARCFAAAVQLGQQCSSGGKDELNNAMHRVNGDQKNLAQVLEDLTAQLRAHLEEVRQQYSTPAMYPWCGPYRTRLSTILSLDTGTLLLDMLSIVLYIHRVHENSIGNKTDDSHDDEELLKEAFPTKICDIVKAHKKSLIRVDGDKHTFHPEVLENLVLLTETLSQVVMLAGACQRILKPVQARLVKRGKKKKAAATPVSLPPTFEHYAALLTGLATATKDLLTTVKDIDPSCLALDLSKLKLTQDVPCLLPELESVETEVWKKVESSYQVSAKELSQLLTNKLEYLRMLKL